MTAVFFAETPRSAIFRTPMAFNQRHDAREATIQFLMHCEMNGKMAPDDVTAEEHTGIWEMRPTIRKVRAMATELTRGVLAHRSELDERIQRHCHHYQMHRMNSVDRNVLRLAVFEMFHCLDVPPVVALHEAIEIAKRFGTDDSGRFVNGILDHVKEEVTRPWRTAVESEKAADPEPRTIPAREKPAEQSLVVDDLF